MTGGLIRHNAYRAENMAQDDDWFRQSEAELESNTRRGLRILAFYVVPAAMLLWATWSFVRVLFTPAIVAGVIAYFLWRFRDTPAVEWIRDRALQAWSWIRCLLSQKPRVIAQTPSGAPVVEGSFSIMPSVAWGAPPQDDEHAWYRQEYLRTHQMLPHQSPAPHDPTRRGLLLHNAEMLDALLIRGDRVPLRTIHDVADTAPRRRFSLGALLSGVSHLHLWAIGGLVVFGGFQFARAEYHDNRADKARLQVDNLRVAVEQRDMEIRGLQADIARQIMAHDADRAFLVEQQEKQAATLRRVAQRHAALARREQERANEAAIRDPASAGDWGERLRQLERLTASDSDGVS